MLVLTRKPNEEIIIDHDIRLSILSISGQKVRIGIDAPPEISVHRREVAQRIENQRLGTACPLDLSQP